MIADFACTDGGEGWKIPCWVAWRPLLVAMWGRKQPGHGHANSRGHATRPTLGRDALGSTGETVSTATILPVPHRFVFRHCLVLLAIAAASGCSSFDQDWRRAGREEPPDDALVGRWEGQWVSDVNGHTGRLRCVISRENSQYQASYKAWYQGILTFEYKVAMTVDRIEGERRYFTGTADLGALTGGVYAYTGHTDGTQFFSTYTSKHDRGRFEMKRVQASAKQAARTSRPPGSPAGGCARGHPGRRRMQGA